LKGGEIMADEEKQHYLKVLGQNIYRLRTEQKMSQTELAKRCGYEANNSRSTISKIEKGINDVGAAQLQKIAQSLGVSVAELTKDTSSQQEVFVCNLIKQCYGTDAYRIVKMYMMLNEYGKKTAFERVQELTELEKYVKGDAEKQRRA
jgi:transcriptional regulator with XRE-family HTH domain